MSILTKSGKIDKRTIPTTTPRTKDDWLSPLKFAKKYGYPQDITNEISLEIYKKGLILNNKTHTPMVVKNKRTHSAVQPLLLLNPDATEIIIDKIKARMAR